MQYTLKMEEVLIMKLLDLCRFDEKGGGLVEYVLITALITIAAVTTITSVGAKIGTIFYQEAK